MSDASVRAIDGRVVVRVGGSELLEAYVGQAIVAAGDAAADKTAAELAAATALASSRYFPTRVAGEAGSDPDELFSTDDGAGNLIYYRRESDGSMEIGRALTPARLAAPDGGSAIGYEAQDVQTKLGEMVSVRDKGALGDGSSDDHDAFDGALNEGGEIYIPTGDYQIGSQLGEYQLKPMRVRGAGSEAILRPMYPGQTILRIGAVGGEFGDIRSQVMVEQLKYKAPESYFSHNESGQVDGYSASPWALTGIDIEATHPVAVRDVVMISMGPAALKVKACYYGYILGLSMAGSGLRLFDVNAISIIGSDIRPDGFIDDSFGVYLFGNEGRYAIDLEQSDKIAFTGSVIELWGCPAIRIRRSYDTTFTNCWFEANRSTTHVIKWEQAQGLEFNSCWLDFGEPFADCFIKIDNSSLNDGAPENVENARWTASIRIDGGDMVCLSASFGDAGRLVRVSNGERAIVRIEGLTFRGGHIWGDRTVDFDVKSITLSGSQRHFFYSLPNAAMLRERNSWMPRSVTADWDFQNGPNMSVTGGGTASTTSAAGEFLTGSRGAKVGGIPTGAIAKVTRVTTGEMGAITPNSGQTYLIFARVKCTQNVTLKIDISGGFAEFAETPTVEIEANKWLDFVVKTGGPQTQSQGLGTPTISFAVANGSGNTCDFLIDRFDYQICDGDHVI
jgi:hypothetical protein